MVIFFLKMALGSGIQLNKNFFSSLFSWQFWKKMTNLRLEMSQTSRFEIKTWKNDCLTRLFNNWKSNITENISMILSQKLRKRRAEWDLEYLGVI